MKCCHIVCGAPASGKTTYATRLAGRLEACLLDSDQVADRLVRSGLELAGLDPNDRDSDAYKSAYRDAVYETLFDLAVSNLPHAAVVICGPFTGECDDPAWPDILADRLGVKPELHYVSCDPDIRRRRMLDRGEARDRSKLDDWDAHLARCRNKPPVWPHHNVVDA